MIMKFVFDYLNTFHLSIVNTQIMFALPSLSSLLQHKPIWSNVYIDDEIN